MTMKSLFPVLALLLVAGGALVASIHQDEPFPHEAHEGLFPVCEGCHMGVVTGAASDLYPDPASCTRCHDGTRQERIQWERSGVRISNLIFEHPDHVTQLEAAGETATCQSCHAAEAPAAVASRMAVAGPQPEGCLECHAHQADTHLSVTAECVVCHVPLTRARELPTARIAAFPLPESHEAPGFLSEHAPDEGLELASCAMCHARESCERCHANADRLDPVQSLERDARVASLEAGMAAEYPVPDSHLESGWSWDHGATAVARPAQCSNCHTQPSCTECHLEGGERSAAVIAVQPAPIPDAAHGVDLTAAGETLHPFDFDRQHATFAATGSLQCNECHSQQYCSDCHAGAGSGAFAAGPGSTQSNEFHPENFMERHAMEVFSGASDCQSCHSTEAFCRDCHEQTGIASQGQLDVAFHTAQPLWILSHGQAARIGLESCASCHRQTDCLACHSTFLGRGVNPHGPGFDAERMAARNRVTCRWCHLSDPIGVR